MKRVLNSSSFHGNVLLSVECHGQKSIQVTRINTLKKKYLSSTSIATGTPSTGFTMSDAHTPWDSLCQLLATGDRRQEAKVTATT